MPDPIDMKQTTQWAIASVGGGGYFVGGSAFALANCHTARQAALYVAGGGYTTVLGAANVSFPSDSGKFSWTYFETSRPANFADFDEVPATMAYASAIIYGWTWLTIGDGFTPRFLANIKCPGWQIGIPAGQLTAGMTKIVYNSHLVSTDYLLTIPDIDIPLPPEEPSEPIRITQHEDQIFIPLSEDTLFDFGKAVLRPDSQKSLLVAAAGIRSHPEWRVNVIGYTDSIGTPAQNQLLSEQRAASVKDWLVKHRITRASNVEAFGHGAQYAVAPNTHPDGSDNPAGRALNRRVEVVLKKC